MTLDDTYVRFPCAFDLQATVATQRPRLHCLALQTVPPAPHAQAAIQAHVPGAERLRLSPDASPISEELNLLYAQHELCSETTTDMLDWFEGFGGSGRQGAQGGDSAAAS